MKTRIILSTLIILAFAAPLAMLPADSSVYAQTAAPGVQDQKEMQTPPPTGVSPAQPGVNPPSMDSWRCPKCGAEHSCKVRKPKNRFYRPNLAPQGPGMGAGCEAGQCREMRGRAGQGMRERGMCGMHATQRRDHKEMCRMQEPGMGRGAGRCCEMHGQAGMGMKERGMRGMHATQRHDCKEMCGQGMGGQGMGNPAMRLSRHAEELNLSKDQAAKLDELADAMHLKVIDLRAAIEKERLELNRLIQSDSNDLAEIKRHLNAIAQSRADIQEARISNMINTRNILTDEQKKQLKEQFPRMGCMLD